MDYLAPVSHQKLVMTRNPIVVIVDPVVLSAEESRVDLRYYLELYVQKSFQSSQFVPLPMQEASEKPIPVGFTSSPGAFFEVQARLDDELKATPPVYGDQSISICPDLTRQYYYTTQRWNGDEQLDTESTTTMWAIRAQIAMRHYSMYKDNFFTKVIGPTGKFLTWQPDGKFVRVDQPERLYFLTNFTPSPKQLQLRVRVLYIDGSRETFTAMQADNITPMTVYCLPVGFSELGLGSKVLAVLSYEVWLSNEDTLQVSEVRTFRVDRRAYESVRYLVFQNSLGGYDTLRCVGSPSESVVVQRQIVERFTDYDYLPTVSDVLINSVTSERQITLNVGNWLNAAYREYLEELLISEEFYIVDNEEFIPLTPTFNNILTQSVAEWPIERTLSFSYSNPIGGYSQLPKIVPISRPTSWRQYSVSCELNANGIRTGNQLVNELVKYYLDTGANVKPLVTKANITGTEGYIPPWPTGACESATTPFFNVAISGPSSLRKQDCLDGKVGQGWTMVIPAGAYGSELSQADADAKAHAAFSALDTQANANLYGSCIVPVNVGVGLQNWCPGDENGAYGGSYNPIASVIQSSFPSPEIIPNTSYTGAATRFAGAGLPAGTWNIDVRCIFAAPPTLAYRIRIPSRNLDSGVLGGNITYRFANIPLSWGDPDLIIIVEPA